MTSNLEPTLQPPVRILIRTPPDVLDNFEPGADTKLIRNFSTQLLATDSSKITIQHLITKVTKRAMIIFDYGVQAEGQDPRVVAFTAKLNGSSLSFSPFRHPQVEQLVNDTVRIWGDQNSQHGWKFPSRTDLRQKQQPSSSNVSALLLPRLVLATDNVLDSLLSQLLCSVSLHRLLHHEQMYTS